MSASRANAYAGIGIVLLLAGTMIANIAAQGIFINEYVSDLFFVFDASWRIKAGQIPHTDFISPIGQAFYWPFAVVLKVLPYSAKTILWANLLVAALLTIISWAVLRRRLSPLLFFLAAASIVLGILSPRDADSFTGNVLSYLAPYNRWSWGLVALVAYMSMVAPLRCGSSQRAQAIDGIALGTLLFLLAYLKITYFAGALLLVGIGLLSRSLGTRILFIAASVFFAGALSIELMFHNTAGYISDILYAVDVSRDQRSTWRFQKFGSVLRLAAAYLALIIALSWLASINTSISWKSYRKPLLAAAVSISAGAVIAYQNHSTRETNLYVVGVIVFAELARRASAASREGIYPPEDSRPSAMEQMVSQAPIVLAAVAAAVFSIVDAFSIVRETLATRDGSACFVPELGGSSLAGFMQSPRALEGTARKYDVRGFKPGPEPTCHTAQSDKQSGEPPNDLLFQTDTVMLRDLTPVLRRTLGKSDRLLVMDFANPYSAIFQLEPVEGDLAWWDESRTISSRNFPAAERLLQSPSVVVQSKIRRSPLLWNLYGNDISARYRVAAETRWWRVWRRSDNQGPRPLRPLKGDIQNAGTPSLIIDCAGEHLPSRQT